MMEARKWIPATDLLAVPAADVFGQVKALNAEDARRNEKLTWLLWRQTRSQG